jgi:hypothetical protein
MPVAEQTPRNDSSRSRRRAQVRLGAVIAVALAVAFVVWFVATGDDGDGDETLGGDAGTSAATAARAATQDEISELAASLDYPIYWAGPISNRTYELTRTESGRVYIRYLPAGVEPGDPNPRYLTVGTYPQANGFAAVRAASRRPNTLARQTRGGALIVSNRSRPRSAYFSFPRARFQVEVFDPEPGRARRLTLSGRITRVR